MSATDFRAQKKWVWDHTVYLFLGGLGSAAYVVGAITGFLEAPMWTNISKIGIAIGFPAVAVGGLFLFAGLGSPMKAFHAWKKPGTAWISRGVLFLSVFMACAFLHLVLYVWPSNWLVENAGIRHILSVVGIIFALGAMTYTGFLLAAARPIAFWSTGILPMLFLVSALASGLLAVIFVSSLFAETNAAALKILAWHTLAAVVFQGFVLMFHMQATHRVPEGKAAAKMLLGSGSFWAALILAIVVPIVLIAVRMIWLDAGQEIAKSVLVVAAGAGVVGNYFIRDAVLKGGVFARLKAGRFEYSLTNP